VHRERAYRGDRLVVREALRELRGRSREVRVAGAPVDLTPREFELLCCLVENAGIALSRDRLLERVWGLEFPAGTRTVDQHVAQLRTKLGRPELIKTVFGVGYKAVGT